MKKVNWFEPETIFDEYRKGANYKSALGKRGLYEQNRINERFFVGDQWNGVQCGDQKPLLRYNIIKRIGEYKMSMVTGAPLAVRFSAEGVPNTAETKQRTQERKDQYRQASIGGSVETGQMSAEDEVNLLLDVLGDYFKVTAERVKFDDQKTLALRKAYTSGTGVLYTYWDETIRTGQYADDGRTSPITGDIRCEVLDIENVYFGDPTLDDVQAQPYIIIAQRRDVEELKREARRNHRPADEVEAIRPDRDTEHMAGEDQHKDNTEDNKATVLTKFYKEYNEDGTAYSIRAVRVVQGAVIRKAWDIGVRLYPLARICWETVANCAYGTSEVTHLVPNQIAINRAVTAAAEAIMMMGMPIMMVDGDAVPHQITNDPGQIVTVYGDEAMNGIKYVTPPNFTPQFDGFIDSMMAATLSQAGANDAALGDMRPENTSAIIAVREAATMPLQLLENRFYSFVEDVARIWVEFWICMYGQRRLKMEDKNGTWYIPFDGDKCRDYIVNARVDVGPANLWSEITVRQTLDNLFQAKVITPVQYLSRLPKGSIPEQESLLEEVTAAQGGPENAGAGNGANADPQALLEKSLTEQERQAFARLSPEQQAQVLKRMAAAG